MPERQRTCLAAGAYALNWVGCGQCGLRALPEARALREEAEAPDAEGAWEEETTFEHVCAGCEHVVAEHFYKFAAEEAKQEFFMECVLCGKGSDEVSLVAVVEPPEETCDGALEAAQDTTEASAPDGPDSALANGKTPAEQSQEHERNQADLMEGLAARMTNLVLPVNLPEEETQGEADDEWD